MSKNLKVGDDHVKKVVWILFGILIGIIVIGALNVIQTTWLFALGILSLLVIVALYAWWQKNIFVVAVVTWYLLILSLTSFSSNFTMTTTCKIASDCINYTVAGPSWLQELFGWFVPFLGEMSFLVITASGTVGLMIATAVVWWQRMKVPSTMSDVQHQARVKEWSIFISLILSIFLVYPIIIINFMIPGVLGKSDAYLAWPTVFLFGVLNVFQWLLLLWLLRISWLHHDWRFLTFVLTWFWLVIIVLTITAALVVNPNNPLMNFGSTLFNLASLFSNLFITSIPLALQKAQIFTGGSYLSTTGVIACLLGLTLVFIVREKIRDKK